MGAFPKELECYALIQNLSQNKIWDQMEIHTLKLLNRFYKFV